MNKQSKQHKIESLINDALQDPNDLPYFKGRADLKHYLLEDQNIFDSLVTASVLEEALVEILPTNTSLFSHSELMQSLEYVTDISMTINEDSFIEFFINDCDDAKQKLVVNILEDIVSWCTVCDIDVDGDVDGAQANDLKEFAAYMMSLNLLNNKKLVNNIKAGLDDLRAEYFENE